MTSHISYHFMLSVGQMFGWVSVGGSLMESDSLVGKQYLGLG